MNCDNEAERWVESKAVGESRRIALRDAFKGGAKHGFICGLEKAIELIQASGSIESIQSFLDSYDNSSG